MNDPAAEPPTGSGLLERMVSLRAGEGRMVALSCAYFFCLLCAYYVLRPVRDEMGIQGGIENLQWLFTATFVAMLCLVPLFGWISSRYPRRRFVPAIYVFFLANVLLFHLLFDSGIEKAMVARVFFVWLSVFNLFVVSVFWSFMVDVFSSEQGRRLFGLIAAGGSAGAVAGPALTSLLVVRLGPVNLLLVSAIFLAAALWCVVQLGKQAAVSADPEPVIGGGLLDGVRRVVRSRYLLGVVLYIVLYTTLATFLYFTQAYIVREAFTDGAQRTQVFALMDLATNVLTIFLQLFVTGRLASRFGVGFTLALVPVLLLIGFIALGFAPVLGVLVAVQIVRRAGNYAIARPSREMLFSVLGREDKYKSKNFIDTVIYRGGDAVSGWFYAALTAVGMGTGAIAWLAAPLALLWAVTGWRLGSRRDEMERTHPAAAVIRPGGAR
jgi:AAA family ATP:ADP antiporter